MRNKDEKKYKILEKAIRLSIQLHKGQLDMAHEPYFLHPLRVMQRVAPDIEAMTVAILHDVEDVKDGIKKVRKAGLPKHIFKAISILAFDYNKADTPYTSYIRRVQRNRLAARVKVADLQDNLDKRRLLFIRAAVARLGRNYNKWVKEHKKALNFLKKLDKR